MLPFEGCTLPTRASSKIKEGSVMHCVVRQYFGTGAKELFDLLDQRKSEVEPLIRGVKGFVAYQLLRTNDGGISVTTCQDKAGTDESLQVAADWVSKNASIPGLNPPQVSEGPIILSLERGEGRVTLPDRGPNVEIEE